MTDDTKPIVPVAIYQTDDYEVHMMGEYVAVKYVLKHEERTLTGADGLTYHARVAIAKHPPYIGFPIVHHGKDKNGEFHYLDDDMSIDGGISALGAEKVAAELLLAARYLRQLEAEHAKPKP